jgi:chemotaxis protein methyltransferase CheR
MIKLARAAVYGDRSVKGVPADYNRHLLASGTGFRVHPETSRLVRVEKLNLNDRVQMNAMRGYDFIFLPECAYLLRRRLPAKSVESLLRLAELRRIYLPGHAESVGRITSAFRLKRAGGHLLYTKD